MTKQEIFNTVAKHLLKQGAAAVDGAQCVYRDPSGASCAVGCLIPDEVYDEAMEGDLAADVISGYPALHHLLPHLDLVSALQSAHDFVLTGGQSNKIDRWAARMRNVAQDYHLDASVLD